jgi:hypothetical protein
MALKLEEKKATTVQNVFNLTLIALVKFSLHSYKFSRLPTYLPLPASVHLLGILLWL